MALKDDLISKTLQNIRNKLNDDQGWFRGGQFTPKQQMQTISNNVMDDEGWYRQGKFTPFKQIGDYNPTGNMSLRQAIVKLPEQAQQDWGQANLVRGNKLLQKYAPQAIKPLSTAVELGPAAYMNTWSKGVSTFARDTTPMQKVGDLVGVAGSINPAYASKNLLGGPLGVVFNAVGNAINNATNDNQPDVPLLSNWKQGWQQGQEYQFKANVINQLTSGLTNKLAETFKFLKPLTEKAIEGNKIIPTDTLKEAARKWLTTTGKRLLRAATIETAVETPVWAILNKDQQESFVASLQQEAVENFVMNVGMAGLTSAFDARRLAPMVKNSLDQAVTNYLKYSSSPEGMKAQAGYINMFGGIVDGSNRTKAFDEAVYTLKENKNATPEETSQATDKLMQIAKQVLTPEQYKKTVGQKGGAYHHNRTMIDNLIDVVGKNIEADVKSNTGYKEPITIKNLLGGENSQRGAIDLSPNKPFPQQPRIKISTNQPTIKTKPKPTIKVKTPLDQTTDPLVAEAKKYKSAEEFVKAQKPKDFQQQVIAGQDLIDEIRSAGLNKNINADGTITIYHGTSNANSKKILKEGKFRDMTFFSPLKSKSAFGSEGAEQYVKNKFGNKGSVLEVKVDARDINFNSGSGEIEASDGLVRGIDGTWRSPTRPQLTDIWNQANQPTIKTKPSTKVVGVEGSANIKVVDNLQSKAPSVDQLPATKLQTTQSVSSKVLPQPSITKSSTPEEVAQSLPNRIDNFITNVLGYSTKAPEGGTRQAGLYTKTLRKGQEVITTKVEQGLASENAIIRNAATTLQNFFRGLGMSPDRAKASADLRGGMATANDRAFNVMDTLYQSLGNNKKSLERINAVLDPELAKTKISFGDLTDTEKQVYGLIREGLDLVHDTSYANGHISPELYAQNKGKYVPRLYEVTELPPEVDQFIKQGKRIDNKLYNQRGELNDWKIDNNLNDPVYGLGKRLAQVETNKAIKTYTDYLASNPRFVSDVERPGFTKLSDSKAYGSLAGKYVLNSAAEDLKGFFFSNQAVQNLYDVFRAYDKMGIRQLQKQLLTVFNPTTNVGNIVSDQIFGFLAGVDPFTLNKNVLELSKNPAKFKQLNDYLLSKNVTGTDITRTDFVDKMASIDSLSKPTNKIKVVADKVKSFYGGTDDAYKVAAFKSLLDKGFSLEEATRKVADGFQNYANVGKFFDVAAKTPIFGKPFIKFQGDLIRIIKNGVVNNPLGLITFLGTLKGISYLSSKLSGESDEDRITRENRFAAPMIPGLNIPLTWQTPWGEINVARYISPFFANNDTTNIASNMIPFVPNIDPKKDVATNISQNVNDPLVAPFIQAGLNRDFRGKPISDPNENKYQPSTLTPGEKTLNTAKFMGRSYLPPPVNSLLDVGAAIQGKPNMYGTPQTVGQSIARLGGVKISNYGPEQVQEIREKEAMYNQRGNEFIQQQINSVIKQQLKGEITPQQAEKRIANLEKGTKTVDANSISGSQDKFSYINDNGNLASLDLTKLDDIAKMPETNRYETSEKQSKQFTKAASILDNDSLTQEQKLTAIKRLGVSIDDASYYRVANDSTNLKTMYVMDSIERAIQSGADPMQLLVGQRRQVNGKMIATNSVLDNLVDEGYLTKEQAKELKKYKSEDGKLVPIKTSASGGRKVSLKKVTVSRPSTRKVRLKRMSVPKLKTISSRQYKPIKYSKEPGLKIGRLKIKQ